MRKKVIRKKSGAVDGHGNNNSTDGTQETDAREQCKKGREAKRSQADTSARGSGPPWPSAIDLKHPTSTKDSSNVHTQVTCDPRTKTGDEEDAKFRMLLRRKGDVAGYLLTPFSSETLRDEHRAFWESLPDEKFFGPDVEHLYFYDEVTGYSVQSLRQQILAAARGETERERIPFSDSSVMVSPKPIIVHVHSPGGDMFAGRWLASVFNQVRVPICTMIDSISASAATYLTVSAPYRVMTPFSRCMMHEYSLAMTGKREELVAMYNSVELTMEQMKNLYEKCTRFTSEELDDLLRRDILLSADECLQKGVCDRVIFSGSSPSSQTRPKLRLDSTTRKKKSNASPSEVARGTEYDKHLASSPIMPFMQPDWNIIQCSCTLDTVIELDSMLRKGEQAQPIVFIVPGDMNCEDPKIALSIIPRLRSMAVPVIGLVDNIIYNWWHMLPLQFCNLIYMYDDAEIFSDLSRLTSSGEGLRLKDLIHNKESDLSLIHKAFSERGRPSKDFLVEIADQTKSFSARECLAMGIVDELVPTGLSIYPEK